MASAQRQGGGGKGILKMKRILGPFAAEPRPEVLAAPYLASRAGPKRRKESGSGEKKAAVAAAPMLWRLSLSRLMRRPSFGL